jgi:aldehyde dehydrogenase (NAD+)
MKPSLYPGSNYVNGKFKSSRKDFNSVNPSNEEILGEFPQSTPEEIQEAIETARVAFSVWKNISRVKRAEYFWNLCKLVESRVDFISSKISLETGKTLNESKAEVIEALHMAQYCFGKARESNGEIVPSEIAEKDCNVIRKPKGVVAVIAPWNFPFAIGGFWCAGPSLIEGNTVIFKPSELTPIVGQITAELFHEAGFPPGVFNLVHGDGNVGECIVNSDLVDHICFTGSAEVGRSIRIACANSWHKTCSCEMGSKSAVMVFDDADLDIAIPACVNSAFKLSGQRCVSAGRLLVQRGILDVFKEKFIAEVERCHIGDPFAPIPGVCSVSFGPLISKDQKTRVEKFNDMVLNDKDCDILHYPVPVPSYRSIPPNTGYYVTPLVYQCEWSNKEFLKQEVFGPHVAIIPFDTIEDAIRIYNDTDYGLSLGLITNDFKKARKIRDNCDFGLGYWNGGSIAAESHMPFGGVKKSGNGQPSAAGLFDSIVHKVSWTVNYGGLTFPQGLK